MSSGAAAAAAPTPGVGRVVLESEDELRSTWEHRFWVGSTTLLCAAAVQQGLSRVHDTTGAAEAVVAALAAYWLSDFGTGIYHWIGEGGTGVRGVRGRGAIRGFKWTHGPACTPRTHPPARPLCTRLPVDNYGDGDTPVLGSQIVAFQGHHVRPWTITEREFCNNVHKVFKPALPVAALLLGAAALGAPIWLDVWAPGMTLLACMSQQFHAWSHMKKSELHPVVAALQVRRGGRGGGRGRAGRARAGLCIAQPACMHASQPAPAPPPSPPPLPLQDAGVLISRKAHGAHHKAPFEGNYCIVSGWWNPVLDGDGSGAFACPPPARDGPASPPATARLIAHAHPRVSTPRTPTPPDADNSFFRRLERLVHAATGLETRCWHEPAYELLERETAD